MFKYSITGGEVTISGYTENASGDLILPNKFEGCPVTDIGRNAFFGCTKLTSVVIPNGGIVVGNYAFEGCSSLTSATSKKTEPKVKFPIKIQF